MAQYNDWALGEYYSYGQLNLTEKVYILFVTLVRAVISQRGSASRIQK